MLAFLSKNLNKRVHQLIMCASDMDAKDYVTLKIPKELADEIDSLIGKKGFRSRAEVTKEALRHFLLDYPRHPTLEHFNLDEQGIRILDHSLATSNSPKGRIIDVYFKPDKALCAYCESTDCHHVEFALGLPEVKEMFRKKGWALPDLE